MAKKAKPKEEWQAETDIWPVIQLIEELSVGCFGKEIKLPCNGIAEGCIGVLPVFKDEAAAIAWAYDQATVRKWALARRAEEPIKKRRKK